MSEETSSIEEKIRQEKEKAYYSTTLNMWYTLRLEKDKQLLTLSVTALGVLVTLLRTVGVSNKLQAVLFSVAIIFFFFTIVIIIFAFGKNADYLELILKEESILKLENLIKILDSSAVTSFVIAMLVVVCIGINIACDSFNNQEKRMSNESKESQKIQVDRRINIGKTVRNDGMQGAASMRPQPPKTTPSSPNDSPSQGSNGTQSSSSQNGKES